MLWSEKESKLLAFRSPKAGLLVFEFSLSISFKKFHLKKKTTFLNIIGHGQACELAPYVDRDFYVLEGLFGL